MEGQPANCEACNSLMSDVDPHDQMIVKVHRGLTTVRTIVMCAECVLTMLAKMGL